MFHEIYTFSTQSISHTGNLIPKAILYTKENGYGFVIPQNRLEQEDLQIPEVNSGFDPWYWLDEEEFMTLSTSPKGISAQKIDPSLMPDTYIPLCFKVNVPSSGNYKITLTIQNTDDAPHSALIFSGRRRLMFHMKDLPAHHTLTQTCLINVSDIIPRGRTTSFNDLSLDIALIGDYITLTQIEIEACNAPTLYIGGDSTVTDQNTSYPYHPSYSYCGWGQMLSAFLDDQIALSNHAHSGLTSETFRSEGHYKIIEDAIKPGDFFIFQFGHNDQKLPELDAYGGYTKHLTTYIREIKEKGAIPILVTPLARNTWFANGSYNDLLADYANACKLIAEKESIPLIDLHAYSMAFVKEKGLEKAKAYFFPKDYTHTNDYGGFYMARFIATQIAQLKLPIISDFIHTSTPDLNTFSLNHSLPLPTPPADYQDLNQAAFEVSFTDITNCSLKSDIIALTQLGIISNQDTLFNPNALMNRVTALSWIIKTVGFVPMNVYNDHYLDVIGHEWYAGTVEVAYQNAIIPTQLTSDGNLHPLHPITTEEMIYFMLSSYQCRKHLPTIDTNLAPDKLTLPPETTLNLLNINKLQIACAVFNLSLESSIMNLTNPLTRHDAVYYISKLHKALQ